MNNNFKNLFIIITIVIMIILAYCIGIYAKNVVAVSNSEIKNSTEVSDEIPFENSEEDFEIENEISISDSDLTNETEDVIIIKENEAVEEPTVEDIIMNECKFETIDYIALIDSFEEGNWYAYYICAEGDCYVITLKGNCVDVCCMLN